MPVDTAGLLICSIDMHAVWNPSWNTPKVTGSRIGIYGAGAVIDIPVNEVYSDGNQGVSVDSTRNYAYVIAI